MIELQKIGDLVVYKLRLVSNFDEKQTSNENAGAIRRNGGLSTVFINLLFCDFFAYISFIYLLIQLRICTNSTGAKTIGHKSPPRFYAYAMSSYA